MSETLSGAPRSSTRLTSSSGRECQLRPLQFLRKLRVVDHLREPVGGDQEQVAGLEFAPDRVDMKQVRGAHGAGDDIGMGMGFGVARIEHACLDKILDEAVIARQAGERAVAQQIDPAIPGPEADVAAAIGNEAGDGAADHALGAGGAREVDERGIDLIERVQNGGVRGPVRRYSPRPRRSSHWRRRRHHGRPCRRPRPTGADRSRPARRPRSTGGGGPHGSVPHCRTS